MIQELESLNRFIKNKEIELIYFKKSSQERKAKHQIPLLLNFAKYLKKD